jgi:hypothetical protein
MSNPAISTPRPTYSQPGFAQLIISKLQPVQGVKQSDLAAMVLNHFGPVKHKERLTTGDIKLVMQRIQETTDRTLNKHYNFSADAKASAQSVAHAFAEAVQDIVANPLAAEPAEPVRKLEPARPNFRRELMQGPVVPAKTVTTPITLVRDNGPAPAKKSEPKPKAKPQPQPKRQPRTERPVSQRRPVKKISGAAHAPEGWLGMVEATKTLHSSPNTLRPLWERIVQAAEQATPATDHTRTLELDGQRITCMLAGERRKFWYIAPDSIAEGVATLLQESKDAAKAARKASYAPRPPKPVRVHTPKNPQPPEGWLGMLSSATALRTSPFLLREVWTPWCEKATGVEPDADHIRTVHDGDVAVRMLLGGLHKPSWYMHPEDVQQVLAAQVEGKRQRARRGETAEKPKVAPVLVPEGWPGMVGATKLARTSPNRLRDHWEDLCTRAAEITPDAEHVRSVPLGDATVRMLLGGTRKPHWHMHPDDVTGPLKAVIDAERDARRSTHVAVASSSNSVAPARLEVPKGWLHMSAAIRKLAAPHAEVAHVWHPLAIRADQHTPDAHGIVRFEEKEGPVQMFYGGRGKPTWYMEPKSFDTVLAPRFDTWHRALHPHARVIHTPGAESKASAPHFSLPAAETHEPSLAAARRFAAKPSKTDLPPKPAEDGAKFEISAVVELALGGLRGHVPSDVLDRLRLETNRAFADYKTSSVVTPGHVKHVAEQCRGLEKNGNLPSETRETYRAVANALEAAHSKLGHLHPVNAPARSHVQRLQERGPTTPQRGA